VVEEEKTAQQQGSTYPPAEKLRKAFPMEGKKGKNWWLMVAAD